MILYQVYLPHSVWFEPDTVVWEGPDMREADRVLLLVARQGRTVLCREVMFR